MAVHPIVLSLSHLRKVGCFPAVSAHLRKVGFHRSACECPQNCCSAVLHFSHTCTPLEGGPFRTVVARFCIFPIPAHLRKVGRFAVVSTHLRKVSTVVARFCIFPLPAHLWKVSRFAVVSTHLRKVSNCSMPTRGACGRTSHRIVPLPPLEGGLFSGHFCSPSEGGRGGRASISRI